MAYQQPGGMGSGPPQGGNEQHAPQGTEYTLQGVMRFLQIEWHNHERARNAWDIERAEMKAKIAKQEGEVRSSKRLNDQLSRQIKMLELALRNERNKGRDKGSADAQADASQGTANAQESAAKGKETPSRPPLIPHNSFLDTLDPPETTMEEREQYKDKSRKYLEKCMQEIQYLLSPPPHPPPPQLSMQNGPLPGLPEPPPSLDEVLAQQRQQRNTQAQPHQILRDAAKQKIFGGSPRQSMPQTNIPIQDSSFGTSEQVMPQQLPRASETRTEPPSQQSNAQTIQNEEPVETITHSFDSYGRAIVEAKEVSPAQQSANDISDGWNFGEPTQVLPEPSVHELQGSRRPDTDVFPSATNLPAAKSPPRAGPGSHRRRSSGALASGRRRSSGSQDTHDSGVELSGKQDPSIFKVKFALRGHLDVVRSVVFTGGGSPSEPEICTAGDDGSIKRWIIPSSYTNIQVNHAINDLDIACYFTHRGHDGIITSLAACPSTSFSTGGRASGDGWIFSGGQDATIRVWERGRVDPKATLDGHTDAIWSVCVLPGNVGSVFGAQSSKFGGPERILLVSGSADGTVKVWAVSAPPQTSAAPAGARRGVGGSRRHSVTSGSNHPNSPQPTTATNTPFHHTLLHSIQRPASSEATPTSICALSPSGENFVVAYTDSSVLVFDTRTGEELIGMASNETYDGTRATSINAVVATSSAALSAEASQGWNDRTEPDEGLGAGPTGSARGVEGVVVSGHEDRYIRFFDANSGQCTYSMLAHPSAISSLSLSHDGHEAVSAGHDASIRFWSLDKRICTQDITSHRPMRGEGVCSVVWSQDGRYVVSAGGDGVVKVFAR